MGNINLFKKGDDGIPVMSPSQISLLLTCPAKWRFKYVTHLPDPPGIASKSGNIVHEALESATLRMIEGERISPSEVGAMAYEDAMGYYGNVEAVKEMRPTDRQEALEQFEFLSKQASALATTGWTWFLNSGMKPVSAEKTVARMVDYEDIKVRVGGRLDLLAETTKKRMALVDWKTASKAPSRKADGSFSMDRPHILQQLIYVRCLKEEGINVAEAGTLKLTKTKVPGAYHAFIEVTPEMLAWSETSVRNAIRMVYEGNLEPNPIGAGFLCHPVYCPAYNVCPGSSRHVEAPAND